MKKETYNIFDNNGEHMYVAIIEYNKEDYPIKYILKPSNNDNWNLKPDFKLLTIENTGEGFKVTVDDGKDFTGTAPFNIFLYLRILLNLDSQVGDEEMYKAIKVEGQINV
jgi:hypothetical protein